MRLFIDTADIDAIQIALEAGICDGVTTNPSIMLKGGVTSVEGMDERTVRIAGRIAPRPLSVEVVADDPRGMVLEGRRLASLASNVVVKIPITTSTGESCLRVIHTLSDDGITVNATAMMTFNQLMLAAKAGATYLSLFGGRIDDEGNDATKLIAASRRWLDVQWWDGKEDEWREGPEIIVGSTRTTKNIEDWALAGAHIITVTPDLIDKMLVNARTKETVAQFMADGQKALGTVA